MRAAVGMLLVGTVGLLTLTPVSAADVPSNPAPSASTPHDGTSLADQPLQPEQDLDKLTAQLDAAERRARAAAQQAEAAAATALRAQLQRRDANNAVTKARDLLVADVRHSLEVPPDPPAAAWLSGAGADDGGLLALIRKRQVEHRQEAVATLRSAVARLDQVTGEAKERHDAASKAAADAVNAADTAQRILVAAQQVHAHNQAVLAAIQARQAALEALSRQLVQSVAPAFADDKPSSDGTKYYSGPSPYNTSSAAQDRVLRILETTPMDAIPPGYRKSGKVFRGIGSWYGPGFIGRPTSTGVPFDPEALTCAMLAVPLGTVVHVTTASGHQINLLVNDHGPYGPGRIIDLSMRANRLVGLGLGQVQVEVLEPTG